MKPESEAPIKFPAPSVVKALFVANNKAKEETSSINGTYGDRVKTQIEIGNLHGPSFRHAASIFRKAKNNELKAREHVAHLRFLLDLLDEEFENAGHVGDLDRMSKAAAKQDGDEDEGAQQETAAEAANRIFTEQNRAAAGEALDLENLKTEAPTEPAKPKGRGGRKKAVEAQAEAAPEVAAAPVDDEVPPAPSEDFDEDIRPAFLRAREEEREAGSVH
ncbi:hypothetical protein [Bosea sp. UNC402CLCol]|uniref:hypothetical protein n=1 Tax=Bosea sp. UNC402CLCol TaxID=1510531 RepID=UPI0005709672|nr:hypothetical protein [Bosea sp. UNC402CLCol]